MNSSTERKTSNEKRPRIVKRGNYYTVLPKPYKSPGVADIQIVFDEPFHLTLENLNEAVKKEFGEDMPQRVLTVQIRDGKICVIPSMCY